MFDNHRSNNRLQGYFQDHTALSDAAIERLRDTSLRGLTAPSLSEALDSHHWYPLHHAVNRLTDDNSEVRNRSELQYRIGAMYLELAQSFPSREREGLLHPEYLSRLCTQAKTLLTPVLRVLTRESRQQPSQVHPLMLSVGNAAASLLEHAAARSAERFQPALHTADLGSWLGTWFARGTGTPRNHADPRVMAVTERLTAAVAGVLSSYGSGFDDSVESIAASELEEISMVLDLARLFESPMLCDPLLSVVERLERVLDLVGYDCEEEDSELDPEDEEERYADLIAHQLNDEDSEEDLQLALDGLGLRAISCYLYGAAISALGTCSAGRDLYELWTSILEKNPAFPGWHSAFAAMASRDETAVRAYIPKALEGYFNGVREELGTYLLDKLLCTGDRSYLRDVGIALARLDTERSKAVLREMEGELCRAHEESSVRFEELEGRLRLVKEARRKQLKGSG